MIKLRVEWHNDCPSCGTQLVVDFLNDRAESCVCPWCGYSDGTCRFAVEDDLRQYIVRAVSDIETTANGRMAVSG